MSGSNPKYASESHLQFRGHVKALDGIRGLAILMVLFHHLWPYEWSNPVTKVLTKFSHGGWIGVDLFFVLSGFLISGILIESRNKTGYFKNFIVRRSLRIFPLYFFFLFLGFVVVPWVLASLNRPDPLLLENRSAYPWFLTYMSNTLNFFDDTSVRDWLGYEGISGIKNGTHDFLAITWSLSVEEQFYIVWPAIVFFFGAVLNRVALVVVLGAILTRLAVFFWVDDWAHVTNMATLCRMDSLAMGAWLAHYCRSDRFDTDRWRTYARAGFWIPAVPIIVYLLIFSGGRGNQYLAIVGYTGSAIAFTAMLAMVLDRNPAAWTRKIFESRFFVFFGKYSYGLYLYHMLVWFLLGLWRSAELNPDGSVKHPENYEPFLGSSLYDAPLRFLLVMAITIVISLISFHFMEKRFLRFKSYFESKTR